MTQTILCIHCNSEQGAFLSLSSYSAEGLCKGCLKDIVAENMQRFSWKERFQFFLQRLFRFPVNTPVHRGMEEWGEYDNPIKRLTDFIFTNLLYHDGTKIRYSFKESEPHLNNEVDLENIDEKMQFLVEYYIDGEWHQIIRPPTNLFWAMARRLKLKANIPCEITNQHHGKLFFRGVGKPFIENDVVIGRMVVEELFLIDFQTPLNQDGKPVIIELTWVPSKHEPSPNETT